MATKTATTQTDDLLKQTPPHSLDIEKALLASLMNIEEAWDSISDLVVKEDFYAHRHQQIFNAISHLVTNNEPYDIVMVRDWLASQHLLEEAGGESYLGDILSQSPATLFNLEAYAQRVKELSTLRQLIKASNETLSVAYNPKSQTVADILDATESRIYAIGEQHNRQTASRGPTEARQILTNVINRLSELQENQDSLIGTPTPFAELDNKTQGLQNGDLIIVAARPSMGKTTFAMNLAEGVLYNTNLPVVVFSMEMPNEHVVMRMLSSFGQVHQSNLRSAQMSDEEWTRFMSAVTYFEQKPLYIDDSTALPPSEVRARCRRIAKQHNNQLGLVVVDYLQLMRVPSLEGNRVGEISEISRSLKALARELNCPVVALSQLNRSLENRPNKRPIMSDLRESGAIEQDADIIMFIYRDEIYNENTEFPGQAEIIIGKHRSGPTGTVKLAFIGKHTRFDNLAKDFDYDYD